jgi:hypothetical protein
MSNYKNVSKLLGKGVTNAKLRKSELDSFILYLAPASMSGKNVCPYASAECINLCLNDSGLASVYSSIHASRLNKTFFMIHDRVKFYSQLLKEISNANKLAKKKGVKFAIRLNGTSDLDHLQLILNVTGVNCLTTFENIVFYDYTKSIARVKKYKNTNYHLTFSRSETNEIQCAEALKLGVNVAVVFSHSKPLPENFLGHEVINGDLSDYRPNDKHNCIVGLKAKGKAKKIKSSFVVS